MLCAILAGVSIVCQNFIKKLVVQVTKTMNQSLTKQFFSKQTPKYCQINFYSSKLSFFIENWFFNSVCRFW